MRRSGFTIIVWTLVAAVVILVARLLWLFARLLYLLVRRIWRGIRRRRARNRLRVVPPLIPDRYGSDHRALRQWWVPIVASGRVQCSRCPYPIVPDADWDLDHRPGGSFPAHASCNRRAGALRIA